MHALYCPSEGVGCHKKSCAGGIFTPAGCNLLEEQFEIHRTKTKKNQNLKSGDTVVLKSIWKTTRWLDCTSRTMCTITECYTNEADNFNTSHISECESHHFFKIYAVGREDGRTIRTSDEIRLKHAENDTYLNCQDRKCKLLPYASCPASTPTVTGMDGSAMCEPQKFRVKIVEN